MSPTELLVGWIGKAHGLKGEVVVTLTTNRAERVDPGAQLTGADGAELVVASSRPHQDKFIVRFEGITDRNGAEALRGAELSAAPIDDDDELWVHDLIGCVVTDQDGVERGKVETVQENPASDLLVLDDGMLVPVVFVTSCEPGVSIDIDAPAGLFELDDRAEGQPPA